jgi:beta-1,4-N-acetylglucosaminyltransferase
VLLTLGGGGHTAQMIALTRRLGDRVRYAYVIHEDDRVSEAQIVHPGIVFRLSRTRAFYGQRVATFVGTVRSFMQAFGIVARSGAEVVISAGPGLAFPLFVWAKVLGKRTVFIETWSRVFTRSLAGRLCYRISDVFFVQWPELQKEYPGSHYAGRLG